MSRLTAPVRICGPALAFLALLTAGQPGRAGEPSSPTGDVAEASRLAAAGKRQEAMALLERLCAGDPRDVRAARLRQDLMLAAGRREELLAGYARAEGDPAMRPLVRYLRARAEPIAERRRAELERLAEREPRHFWAAYDLVVLCVAAGDLRAAERWGATARELCPADPDVRNVLGDVYIQAGKLGEAEAELNEALRLRPKFPQAHYNLGLVRAAAGRYKEAAELFARAVEEDPGLAEAWNNRGHCLARLDKAEEAVAAYRKALELRPDYGAAWNNLAVALYRKGDLWAAWAGLEKAEKCGFEVQSSFKRTLAKRLFPEKRPPEAALPGAEK
jgi:protein O-GlcNAc transferase